MTNKNTSGQERPLESDGLTSLLNQLNEALTRMDALTGAPPVVRLPIPPIRPITIWPVSMRDVPDDVSDDLYDAARDEDK